MASQGDQTRPTAPPPPAPPAEGIDLTTLFLSAIASAAAAYITSKIWARGTLLSAAMTPVIVALVKEGLRKPTAKVAEVVPSALPAPARRWSRTSASDAALVPGPADVGDAPAAPGGRDAPEIVLPPVVAADHGPVNVYSTRGRRLRWRLAVLTGLLGFGVCVLLYTVPELIAGQSLGRSPSSATTIFGGHRGHHRTSTSTAPTTSTSGPAKTATTRTTQTAPPQTTPAPAPQPSSATPAVPSTATPSTATPSTATPAP